MERYDHKLASVFSLLAVCLGLPPHPPSLPPSLPLSLPYLGGELLAGGLATGGLTGGLLGASHCCCWRGGCVCVNGGREGGREGGEG